MSDAAILYIVALCGILSVGLFALLAWKFGPRSGSKEVHMSVTDVHLTAQP